MIAVEDDQGGDNNYIPDVLGGLAYNNGTFGAALIGAYDESVGDGAVKARIDAKFGKFQAFLMGGWSSNGIELGRSRDAFQPLRQLGWRLGVWGGMSPQT